MLCSKIIAQRIVFLLVHPYEVGWFVVQLVFIYVVHDFLVAATLTEGHSHKSMNTEGLTADDYLVVTIHVYVSAKAFTVSIHIAVVSYGVVCGDPFESRDLVDKFSHNFSFASGVTHFMIIYIISCGKTFVNPL